MSSSSEMFTVTTQAAQFTFRALSIRMMASSTVHTAISISTL